MSIDDTVSRGGSHSRRDFLKYLGAAALTAVASGAFARPAHADPTTRTGAAQTPLQRAIAAAEQTPNFANYMAAGNAAMQARDYNQARDSFIQAAGVRNAQRDAELTALVIATRDLTQARQYDQSISLIQRLLQDVNYNAALHNNLGAAKISKGLAEPNTQTGNRTATSLIREGLVILYGTQVVKESQSIQSSVTTDAIRDTRTAIRRRLPSLYQETQAMETIRGASSQSNAYDLRTNAMPKEVWQYAFRVIDSLRTSGHYTQAETGYDHLIAIGNGPRVRQAQSAKRRSIRARTATSSASVTPGTDITVTQR